MRVGKHWPRRGEEPSPRPGLELCVRHRRHLHTWLLSTKRVITLKGVSSDTVLLKCHKKTEHNPRVRDTLIHSIEGRRALSGKTELWIKDRAGAWPCDVQPVTLHHTGGDTHRLSLAEEGNWEQSLLCDGSSR